MTVPPGREAPGSVKYRSKFGPGGSPGSNYIHPLLRATHWGDQKCLEMLPFAVEMATFVKWREEYDPYRGRCLRDVRGGPRQSVKREGNALQIAVFSDKCWSLPSPYLHYVCKNHVRPRDPTRGALV